jgi:hypothetical protein
MFGKTLPQYLGFQKLVLAAIVVVGLLRLGLSLAGLPDSTVMWFSITVVGLVGTLWYGVAVHTQGFGSYKQLLPLVFLQMVLTQSVAVFAILLAIAGFQNIFAAPEYSFGAQSQWVHIFAHLSIGILVPTLIGWAIASVVLFVTKRVARRPAVA